MSDEGEMAGAAMSPGAVYQGALWGRQARVWADWQEGGVRPAYERVFDRLDIAPGMRLLDVGCGAGLAAKLAAAQGAEISGVDASAAFLHIARERVPAGDFRVGDILSLPWADNTFDRVIGFNSFQYVANPVEALREAARVAKPGARVGIVVWGSPEQCEAVAHFRALGALMPPPPPGTPGPLAGEQQMAEMAGEAGLSVLIEEFVDCPWIYPDLETALQALMSAGPVARVSDHAGEEAVREALTRCLVDFKQPDGSYVFRNKFRAIAAMVP